MQILELVLYHRGARSLTAVSHGTSNECFQKSRRAEHEETVLAKPWKIDQVSVRETQSLGIWRARGYQ